jgi:hypothetical protein
MTENELKNVKMSAGHISLAGTITRRKTLKKYCQMLRNHRLHIHRLANITIDYDCIDGQTCKNVIPKFYFRVEIKGGYVITRPIDKRSIMRPIEKKVNNNVPVLMESEKPTHLYIVYKYVENKLSILSLVNFDCTPSIPHQRVGGSQRNITKSNEQRDNSSG